MKKRIRSRTFMYVQQTLFFAKSWQESCQDIIDKLKPSKFAYILHDKDELTDGTAIAEHVHLILEFKNPRSLKNVAKEADEKAELFEVWRGEVNNAYSYLIHRTIGDLDKFQYGVSEVVANFDYPKLIEDIENGLKRKRKIKDSDIIDECLNELYEGMITIEEAKKKLNGAQFAKAAVKIKSVCEERQQKLAKEFTEEQKRLGNKKIVLWIYGQAGTGKTRYARHVAKHFSDPYYISGSSRDPFQRYQNEQAVILDELRPKTFEYDDLLKMLDPYNFDCSVPSRYFDKYLTAKIIIITSPYNPRDFYNSYDNAKIDNFEQLHRRIDDVLFVDKDKIYVVSYNEIGYDDFGDVIYTYREIDNITNPYTTSISFSKKEGELFNEIKKIK